MAVLFSVHIYVIVQINSNCNILIKTTDAVPAQ